MEGKPCNCGHRSCPICTLFGSHKSPGECDQDLGPTRLLVRDALLCAEDFQRFNEGRLPMEIKYENIINRVTGEAKHPRPLERVPANVRFDLNIALKIYEGDEEAKLLAWVYKALKLVEMDALGGGSSRGSGQVSFENLCLDGQPVDFAAIKVF